MRWTARGMAALLLLGGAGAVVGGIACKKKGEDRQASVPAPTAEAGGTAVGPSAPADAGAAPTSPDGGDATGSPSTTTAPPALLVTQSRFVAELQPDGTTRQKPGPATLIVLRQAGAEWEPETIEDPDSNVFHKAMVFDPDGNGPAVLTVGAMGAYLKAWRKDGEEWTATTLWHPTFGGSFDRLRDLEIGDVTGDGKPEIVIATHDQGMTSGDGVVSQILNPERGARADHLFGQHTGLRHPALGIAAAPHATLVDDGQGRGIAVEHGDGHIGRAIENGLRTRKAEREAAMRR